MNRMELELLIEEVLIEEGLGTYIKDKGKRFKDETIGLIGSNITKKVQRATSAKASSVMADHKSKESIKFMISALKTNKGVEEGVGSYLKTNVIDVFIDSTLGEAFRNFDRSVNAKISGLSGKLMGSKASIDIANFIEDELDSNEKGMLGSKRMKDSLSQVLDGASDKMKKNIEGLAGKSGGGTNYQIATAFLTALFGETVIDEQDWAKLAMKKMKSTKVDNIDGLVKSLDSKPTGGLGLNSNIVTQIAKKLDSIPPNISLGKMLHSLKEKIGQELESKIDPKKKEKDYTQQEKDMVKELDKMDLKVMKIIAYSYLTSLYESGIISDSILTIETKKELRKKKGKMLSSADAKDEEEIVDDDPTKGKR